MTRMPTHYDDPPQVLFWEIDEFIIIGVTLAVMILTHAFFLSLICGWLLLSSYRRMSQSRHRGFLIHMAYWFLGLGSDDRRSYPNPFIRRWHA